MADAADQASDLIERRVTEEVSKRAADIPKGRPGDCDMCGEWFGRLVGGACVPCRERYKLP